MIPHLGPISTNSGSPRVNFTTKKIPSKKERQITNTERRSSMPALKPYSISGAQLRWEENLKPSGGKRDSSTFRKNVRGSLQLSNLDIDSNYNDFESEIVDLSIPVQMPDYGANLTKGSELTFAPMK